MSDPKPTAGRRTIPLRLGDQRLMVGSRTLVMGVLNCTPDSFYAASRAEASAPSAARYHEMIAQGADWIDVGGESTRPGASPVNAEDEWARIEPVVLAARKAGHPVPLSVDTTKYEVAARALEAGAAIINDISGLQVEPRLADLAKRYRAGLVLMHMRGTPRTMQNAPHYDDVLGEIRSELRIAIDRATAAGVDSEQIIIDPGIGFGKTAEHNLEIVQRLDSLADLNRPILLGTSRKSFIGALLDLPPEERLEGTLAAHVLGVGRGAHIVRVHDVASHARAVRVADAILTGTLDKEAGCRSQPKWNG